ncbi:MAG TPA: hypothetical protein VIJ82_19250 [Streptosporangiaceae bacterium]
MTSVPKTPAAGERALGRHDTRLVTHIPHDVSIRLRLLAAVTGRPMSHVVAELLARELPTSAELASQMQEMGARDDRAGR